MKVDISSVAKLPTKYGDFLIQSFKYNDKEHLLIKTQNYDKIPNVRIHSECLTGDALSSLKCDCQAQLNYALEYLHKNNGLLIYLRQEGRNIGLFNKVNAYALQDKGLNTIEANHQLGFKSDERTYEIVDFIFEYLDIKDINILTNNPDKIEQLNINIVKRLPICVGKTIENETYLNIKKTKMGHLL
jgi:GTP cyclohydrolase II